MPQDVPARWDVSAGKPVTRLEVWAHGEQVGVATDADIDDGAVSEKWVTGVRRTLSLSVPPTAEWLSWFALPRLELRPYKGLSWRDAEHLCPLGRFQVLRPGASFPRAQISISAKDAWQGIESGDFAYAYHAGPGTELQGLIRDLAAALIDSVQQVSGSGYTTALTATSNAVMPTAMWDKSRSQTIMDLVESIGAEAFFDENGRPRVQDRVSRPGAPLSDGENGTIGSVSSTVDWSAVKNVIAVTSSDNNVNFYPVVVAITDPANPANQAYIDPQVFKYSSPLLADVAQAKQAGLALLEKLSAPALSWQVTCVADPSRLAGDRITVTTKGLGSVTATIQEITHPLTSKPQTITLGAA